MTELGVSKMRPTIERRQTSQTDLLVAAIQASARSVVDATATSATEAAAGALSRAFAAAEVSGPPWAKRAISPAFLAQVGRELVRAGQSMHVVSVSDLGAVELLPCSSWDIGGAGASPSTWQVAATVNSPNRSITRRLPYAGVVFATWGSLAGRPYSGRGPLAFASISARLQSETERSLADESGGPLAQLIPVPEDPDAPGEDDKQAELKQDINGARGGALLVETTAAGHGDGRVAAPRKDWVAERLGPDPPVALTEIMERGFSQMLAAFGCPAGLFADADAGGQREAYRRYYSATVEPLAVMLERELSDKLEVDIGLSFSGRFSGDLAGRARAFQSMVGAGMDTNKAAGLAGLMVAED